MFSQASVRGEGVTSNASHGWVPPLPSEHESWGPPPLQMARSVICIILGCLQHKEVHHLILDMWPAGKQMKLLYYVAVCIPLLYRRDGNSVDMG